MDTKYLIMKWFAVGITFLFLGTCLFSTIAQDTEKQSSRENWLYVGGTGPGNYTKIQDAINNTIIGDTIYVYPGTYHENLFINTTIHLIGEDKNTTIIDSDAHHDTIYIGFPADNIHITGFTIRNSGNYSSGGAYCDAGIEIHSDYNSIDNTILTNHPLYGILLWGSKYNNISYNIITKCNRSGIDFLAGPLNTFTHNLFYDNYAGMSFLGSSNATKNILTYNTFLQNRKGLVMYDSGNQISSNNFINNTDFNAISLFNFRKMIPSRNTWTQNYWDNWQGRGPIWIPGFLGFNFDWNPAEDPYPYQEIPPQASQQIADGTATKWAVLIACSGGFTYERHERRDYNDIRALKQLLLKNGWDEDHILVLLEEQATREAILTDSFQWLRDNGEDQDDLILYLFSGHGYYHTMDQPPLDEPDGTDEIINPWDPDFAGWNPDVVIVDDELSEKFNTLHSQNIVIIICSCHAGGWIDGQNDLAQSGRVVLVSCGVDEASCMMYFPIHWLYPYYLIQGLKGRADKNHDKIITAEELFQYTVKPVQLRSIIYTQIAVGKATMQTPELSDEWPTTQNSTEELPLIDLS
jgi:parallel beta-helix repeat protein